MTDNNRLYRITVSGVICIAFGGFAFNYITLRDVAAGYAMNSFQSYTFPLLLDLFMIILHGGYYYLSTHGGRKILPMAAMYISVALSVMFALEHSGDVNLLGKVAWALPPVSTLTSVEVLIIMASVYSKAQQPQQCEDERPPRYEVIAPEPAIEPPKAAKQLQAPAKASQSVDVTGKAAEYLAYIAANPGVTNQTLAAAFGVSASGPSRFCQSLAAAGKIKGDAKTGWVVD